MITTMRMAVMTMTKKAHADVMAARITKMRRARSMAARMTAATMRMTTLDQPGGRRAQQIRQQQHRAHLSRW
jgi:hypothetical protein